MKKKELKPAEVKSITGGSDKRPHCIIDNGSGYIK